MPADALTDAKRRIVERLQRIAGATAPDLAAELGLTASAVRQHLDALALLGLVVGEASDSEGRRGRPALRWHLTPLAASLFPDRHAELTVEMLELVRRELGPDALDQLIAGRTRDQLAIYEAAMQPARTVRDRAERLADIRTAEGYAAEVVDAPDGDGILLVEHHCPICDAAATCQGFCRGEMEVFAGVLGPDAEISREEHVLAGDPRCTYRIRSPRTVT